MTLDLLRYDAERMLDAEGWTDAVAGIVWMLRMERRGHSAMCAALDAARDIVEPERQQRVVVGVHLQQRIGCWRVVDPWGDG